MAGVEQIEVLRTTLHTVRCQWPCHARMVELISKAPNSTRSSIVEVALGSDKKRDVLIDCNGRIEMNDDYRVVGFNSREEGQA